MCITGLTGFLVLLALSISVFSISWSGLFFKKSLYTLLFLAFILPFNNARCLFTHCSEVEMLPLNEVHHLCILMVFDCNGCLSKWYAALAPFHGERWGEELLKK